MNARTRSGIEARPAMLVAGIDFQKRSRSKTIAAARGASVRGRSSHACRTL
jgi:hypothetical protein